MLVQDPTYLARLVAFTASEAEAETPLVPGHNFLTVAYTFRWVGYTLRWKRVIRKRRANLNWQQRVHSRDKSVT